VLAPEAKIVAAIIGRCQQNNGSIMNTRITTFVFLLMLVTLKNASGSELVFAGGYDRRGEVPGTVIRAEYWESLGASSRPEGATFVGIGLSPSPDPSGAAISGGLAVTTSAPFGDWTEFVAYTGFGAHLGFTLSSEPEAYVGVLLAGGAGLRFGTNPSRAPAILLEYRPTLAISAEQTPRWGLPITAAVVIPLP